VGELRLLYKRRRPNELCYCAKDKHFYPASARFFVKGKDEYDNDVLDQTKLEVWSDLVKNPVAVRYAWARNPLGNLASRRHMERMIPAPNGGDGIQPRAEALGHRSTPVPAPNGGDGSPDRNGTRNPIGSWLHHSAAGCRSVGIGS